MDLPFVSRISCALSLAPVRSAPFNVRTEFRNGVRRKITTGWLILFLPHPCSAARHIERGDADLMLAGGAEAAIIPSGIGGFIACKALSKRNSDPEAASRPWDKGRDGFVMGEGAGADARHPPPRHPLSLAFQPNCRAPRACAPAATVQRASLWPRAGGAPSQHLQCTWDPWYQIPGPSYPEPWLIFIYLWNLNSFPASHPIIRPLQYFSLCIK